MFSISKYTRNKLPIYESLFGMYQPIMLTESIGEQREQMIRYGAGHHCHFDICAIDQWVLAVYILQNVIGMDSLPTLYLWQQHNSLFTAVEHKSRVLKQQKWTFYVAWVTSSAEYGTPDMGNSFEVTTGCIVIPGPHYFRSCKL